MSVLWTANRIRDGIGSKSVSSVVYDVVGLPIEATLYINVRNLDDEIRVGNVVRYEVTWNSDHIKALSIQKSIQGNIEDWMDNKNFS